MPVSKKLAGVGSASPGRPRPARACDRRSAAPDVKSGSRAQAGSTQARSQARSHPPGPRRRAPPDQPSRLSHGVARADPGWSPWSAGPSPGLRPSNPGPSYTAVC